MTKHKKIPILIVALSLLAISVCCAQNKNERIEQLFNKGRNYIENGNLDEGMRIFSMVIQEDDKHYYAYLNRGLSFRVKKNYDQAINDLNQCIQKYRLDFGNLPG